MQSRKRRKGPCDCDDGVHNVLLFGPFRETDVQHTRGVMHVWMMAAVRNVKTRR